MIVQVVNKFFGELATLVGPLRNATQCSSPPTFSAAYHPTFSANFLHARLELSQGFIGTVSFLLINFGIMELLSLWQASANFPTGIFASCWVHSFLLLSQVHWKQ